MEREIRPEPTDDERDAVEAALAALEREREDAARSRWREAGIAEATAPDPRDPAT